MIMESHRSHGGGPYQSRSGTKTRLREQSYSLDLHSLTEEPEEDLNSSTSSLPGINSSSIANEDDNGISEALPSGSDLSHSFSGQRSKSEGKLFSPLADKSGQIGHNKLSKRESLKVQKKHYRKEKKRAAKELLSTLKDPTVIVMADWLKVRGTLKSWTKLWCVLKPGLLVLYKSHKQKSGHWVGTMLLNTCELIERPSKKDGFCFKLFHPLDQSVWATKGPKGENLGAITLPLTYSYVIFRAPSEAAGKCWMDALELALRCSSLLMRTMTRDSRDMSLLENTSSSAGGATFLSPLRQQMNESDCEKHFKGFDLDDEKTDKEEDKEDSETEVTEEEEEKIFDDDWEPVETSYEENTSEELGQQGDECQTEEVADENKSLIWALVKQVRPGMDLSKVVLPTFILEPRSLLDKFADYYYHADLMSEAVQEDDPYTRMKKVVRWYLSGFYKKPKGLKKPYNPILGETFRCYFKHRSTGSRTFYIAEQISHHPPVTAFYITNRHEGFSISGSVLAKSKFYGNSLSAIMDGVGRLTFLKRGEDYHITMPYAHCKGILIGTLTMELGGKVTIECEKTGYRAELEFKLKPFLGAGEASNRLVGKIKLGTETLSTLDGHWDTDIYIKEKRVEPTAVVTVPEAQLFWSVTPDVKATRLPRYTVPLEAQDEFESEKLWLHVSEAILMSDQTAATQEKFILEDSQRKAARERKVKLEEWTPRNFERNNLTGEWMYIYSDLRPWDAMNDVLQYEKDYCIQTKTRHRTPIVRTMSITNIDEHSSAASQRRHTSMDRVRVLRLQRASLKRLRVLDRESGSSTPDADILRDESDSSDSGGEDLEQAGSLSPRKRTIAVLQKALNPLIQLQEQNSNKLSSIQLQLEQLHNNCTRRLYHLEHQRNDTRFQWTRDFILLAAMLVFQAVLVTLFK